MAEAALDQIPAQHVEEIEILLRTDSAGATHELVDWCRDGRIRYSVGYDLTEPVRAAILLSERSPGGRRQTRTARSAPTGRSPRQPTCSTSRAGSRVIVRRERRHPGAQLSFQRPRRHRFQAILTDQAAKDSALLECRHRQRARVEDHIRADKDSGLRNLPFRDFDLNAVWLELVLAAHDLVAWAQALLLSGELAKAEPKRLRHRLLHVAARLAFSGRRSKLRLAANWPWATDLAAAFARPKALPQPAG